MGFSLRAPALQATSLLRAQPLIPRARQDVYYYNKSIIQLLYRGRFPHAPLQLSAARQRL